MVKDTQQRLIKALKSLREPTGSTVPAIVKMVNKEEPQITLKEIVKTLQGCLKNGIMTQCKDRIRLKYYTKDTNSTNPESFDRKEFIQHERTPLPDASVRIRQRCGPKANSKPSKPKMSKSKAKNKPKCPKKKPKCPKSKPKPKPKCQKPKPKCPKPKRPKIQPYCQKQPKCCDISDICDF